MTIQGEVKSYFASECKATLKYTPDSGKALIFNDSGILKAFNDENEEPKVYTILEKATSVSVKDENFIVTSSTGECTLYNFKNSSAKLLYRSLLPLRSACFNHDGSLAIIGGDESELVLVNTSDQASIKVKLSEEINNLSYNKANDLLAITVSSGDVLIYSLNSSPPNLVTKIAKVTHGVILDDDDVTDEDNLLATKCEWSPNNSDYLSIATPARDIKVFSRDDKFEKEEKSFANSHESKIVDFQISSNGKYIASLDLKKNLLLWNFKSQKLIKKFQVELDDEEGNLNKLCWSPDNASVSVSTFGGSVVKYKNIISEDEAEEDSVPFGIDQEAKVASDEENEFNEDDDEEIEGKAPASPKDFAFENEEDFIIDDDHAGYAEKRLFVDDDEEVGGNEIYRHGKKRYREGSPAAPSEPRYRLKPYSPGSTPWHSDRRYLTMNSIGYAWAVQQSSNSTITVSFFDRSLYKEYHFKDLYGFDLSSMNDLGILFATSGFGRKTSLHKAKVMFRPHENANETWEKDIPLQKDEFLTSVTVSNSSVIVGSSTGFLRFFNLFGVPLGLEKQSPIISCITNNKYFLTITFNEKSQSLKYNLQDLDFKYYQRDISLPITIPASVLKNNKHHFIKGIFFSDDGDPAVVGHDNLVMVLSKWRDPLQARWIPILDINAGIDQIGGIGDDLKCWPLGLYKGKLNCIILRGSAKGIYPSFPLPLPTEMDIRVPINESSSADAEDEPEDPEELFVRSKILGELLSDTIASADAEDQFEAEQRLLELQLLYDKSLLKIFVACCNEQNALKAFNIAQELREDKALVASVKIAERMGLIGLVRRINDLRENRMEIEMRS